MSAPRAIGNGELLPIKKVAACFYASVLTPEAVDLRAREANENVPYIASFEHQICTYMHDVHMPNKTGRDDL